MGNLWLKGLRCALLVLAGLGYEARALAQTNAPGQPVNCFTDAPPPAVPEFTSDPAKPPPEYYPRLELSSEAVFYLFQSPTFHFPMVTRGSVNDLVPGAIGQPGTSVLADANTFKENFHVGARVNATYWLTEEPETLGLRASFFYMELAPSTFAASSQGNPNDPVLARPYFNVLSGAEDAAVRASPGTLAGSINMGFYTRMYGADGSILYNVTGYAPYGPSLFLLAGPRYLQFNERFVSNETTTDLPTGNGNLTGIQDTFACFNTFYGAQAGAMFRYRMEGITFDLTSKVAAGNNYEIVNIGGITSVTNQATGLVTSANQGFFAQSSNIGNFHQNVFAVIPEIDLKLHVDLTPNIKVTLGYGFLWLSRLARPADQLDRNINIQPVGGPITHPTAPVRTSISDGSFWSNSLSIGLELVF
jgi:Putative beta barrel porin-7 (BBP7)